MLTSDYLGDMSAISSDGQISAEKVFAAYERYFPESDGDDDSETHVKVAAGRSQ